MTFMKYSSPNTMTKEIPKVFIVFPFGGIIMLSNAFVISYLYIIQFNWKQLLLGDEDWSFLPETLLRSFIMFIVIVIGLTILGKRGVKQLSVFELVVIIGLGSAAGDPMFYKDVGILPAVVVFITVVGSYILVMRLIGKSKAVEHALEGKPVPLIKDGRFMIHHFEKENLAQDEFFSELRLKGVSHLGQVDEAIIETSGQLSVFFYDDKEVQYGLPILPGTFEKSIKKINAKGQYACTFCAHTMELTPKAKHTCPVCKREQWVNATNHTRKR
jgi:uncharacterized membrane protein YcaP (DUF421 family)